MFRRLGAAIACLLLVTLTASAQEENPVQWSIKLLSAGKAVKPGEKLAVELTAQIDPGWHLYALTQPEGGPMALRITVPGGQPFKLGGRVKVPPPETAFDGNFNIDTEFYDGAASFTVPIELAADAPAGAQRLKVNALFQTCNDTLCLPPTTARLQVAVSIAAGAITLPSATAAPAVEPPAEPPAEAAPVAEPASPPTTAVAPTSSAAVTPAALDQTVDPNQSLLSFIWLAMTVGALSLLTPCVFPMVPITVSYFTSHAAGNRRTAWRNALIYSIGIILTFTALGMALALLVGAGGINQFAASPWINLLITGIFVVFALNLFGAYQFQVPSQLLTRLDAFTRREGSSQVPGTLLMGLTFTLTSFTCTAPFVGTLLVMAAQGDWQWPLVGMLAFSTIFALPFFVLALMPQLVSQLPRSGSWLNSVKVIMGFLEIAAAMKFLSNVDLVWRWNIFTREVVLATWVAVAILMAVYLLGRFQLTHDAPVERVGAGRVLTATLCLALSIWLLTGLFGRRLGEIESFLPPATEGAMLTAAATGEPAGELSWITNDYEGALARARQENRLLLVDFTGYTCTNCRWMEANMFPRPEVRRELEKYVRVRLYTDGDGELYQNFQRLQQAKFGTVALPYYAVLTGEGTPVATFPGLTRKPEEFIAFLVKGQTANAGAGVKISMR